MDGRNEQQAPTGPPIVLHMCVGTPLLFDQIVFGCWLNAQPIEHAAKQRILQYPTRYQGLPFAAVLQDTADHYRACEVFSSCLQTPSLLSQQSTFQIDPDVQTLSIERYYSFDESVIRELFGKKLSTRQRRDLDDVEEKTGIPEESCQRQFDNLRRVWKTVLPEDADTHELHIVRALQSQFRLSEQLATDYYMVLFTTHHRLETHKKRMHALNYQHFAAMVGHMIMYWTDGTGGVDLDKTLTDDLRDIKSLLLSDKVCTDADAVLRIGHLCVDVMDEFKTLARANEHVAPYVVVEKKSSRFRFTQFVRSLCAIGADMGMPKDFRDVFVDLVDKVVEPCRRSELGSATMAQLFDFLRSGFTQLSSLEAAQIQRFHPAWVRFLAAAKECAVIMMDNSS